MKITAFGLFVVSCWVAVNCDRLTYVGPSNDRSFIYSYNGNQFKVNKDFHETYQADAEFAERSFLRNSVNFSSRGGETLRHDETSRVQGPTPEEIRRAQSIHTFRPNSRPHISELGIQFPDPSTESDSLPVHSTGFNVPIPKDRNKEQSGTNYAQQITEFALNLFKYSNNQENFVLSPLSPQILLSYLAWVADGQTRNELVRTNGFGNPDQIQSIVSSMLSDSSGRELQIATAFFISQEMRLNQEFLNKAVRSVDVVPVDFKQPEIAGRVISKWAKSKTKGGLKLKEVNYAPATKIALTNAIYFKGNWIYTFQPSKPGTFNTPTGPVQAEMMNMKRKFHWGEISNYAQWVAIPYESSDSLVIILPNEDQKIDYVMSLIEARDLENIIYNVDSDSSKADVNITLPKFKIESTTSLVAPLQKMGITTLFTPRAELPYLSDYDAVEVSNAQQQASMEVNENGTVLIAFTNLNVVALSFQPAVPNVVFNVNRPFIAIIVDRKKNIPFVMAKITNPTAA
ncbi:CLUMA_CG000446, isoform A [Clunio marinus]|uniref:CLUMA_CG000446, isoform A n=1 Tax=Clunio marinus TaxID=568069 RepID=A0A1J1HK32_9DIPT|nr:CLUMA_CG000446, isoform A [Clunio marinus]